MDIDHRSGGIDEARRSRGAAPVVHLPHGEQFPHGIAGARSNGNGLVLLDDQVVRAAQARATSTLDAATPGLPRLGTNGFLPAGVHATTLGELRGQFAANPARAELFDQLDRAVGALASQGVDQVVVGGSLLSAKPVPGDIDLGIRGTKAAVAQAGAAVTALGDATRAVTLFPLEHVLTEAPTLAGKVPGWNVLEFFAHTREGAARGVALLETGARLAAKL